MLPIQKETTLYQSPKTWDWTLYLVLWLVGALMKGFVRPTEDPLNPYSDQMPNIITSFVYFLWFFLVGTFIYLLTARTDGSIPFFGNVSFPPISYGYVFIPYFVALVMLFVTFSVKGFQEWRLVIKQKDPNGDSYFKAVNYSAILLFLILMLITGILLCIKLELPSVRQRNMNMGSTVVLVPIASFIMLCLSIFPFADYFYKIFKKKKLEAQKAKEKEPASPNDAGVSAVEESKEKDTEMKDVELTDKKSDDEDIDSDDSQKRKKKKDEDDEDEDDDDSSTASEEQLRDDGVVEMLTFL